MANASYEKLLERIAKVSGLQKEDVERRIVAKKAKLSDLVSKYGAAQIVASELGASFEAEILKISELLPGMRKASVLGKIIKLFPVRIFKTKNAESKVCSLLLADETSNIRVVLWDTKQIDLIEQGKIKDNDVIEIKNAIVKGNGRREMHLSSLSDIKKSDEIIENVMLEEARERKSISELKENEVTEIRAFVVQAFDPRFFSVCPECNTKISKEGELFYCQKHGNVIPKERVLLSLILDDGTANIRAVFFEENVKKLFSLEETSKLKEFDFFLSKKAELLGKELVFSGRVRMNKMFERLEFMVDDIKEMSAEEIVEELQAKQG